MQIKIPKYLSEVYLGEEYLEYSVSNVGKEQSVRREKELEDIYNFANEDLVERLFIIFFGDTIFDTRKFNFLLSDIYIISKKYCADNGFKGDGRNKRPEKEQELEMYFSSEAQKEIERVIYCSVILIPYFEKRRLSKNVFNLFWGFFKNVNTVDLIVKIEKIVTSKYFGSSGDARFWALAEIYGLTKDSWLLDTMTTLTTKSLLKLEIDKSFAIYCQVIAADSLMYATKQNFTVQLKQVESSKLVNENPDSFINQMILEEELLEYVNDKPYILEQHIIEENFPPQARYLCVLLLDWKFDVSADIILKTASSSEYHSIVRRVAYDIITTKFGCHSLAYLIRFGEMEDAKPGRFFITVKDKDDELLSKYITRFLKYIYDKSGSFNEKEFKLELERFIKQLVDVNK